MMQTRLTRFGIAVRNAREARKLSQQELAQKLNMNKNTIMEIELGRSNPKGETIFLIAAELHISIDSILYSSTDQPNSVSMDVLDFFSPNQTMSPSAMWKFAAKSNRFIQRTPPSKICRFSA